MYEIIEAVALRPGCIDLGLVFPNTQTDREVGDICHTDRLDEVVAGPHDPEDRHPTEGPREVVDGARLSWRFLLSAMDASSGYEFRYEIEDLLDRR